MKKLIGLSAVLALALSAVAIGSASAGNQTPTQCGGKSIVNVTYNLYNDADSGLYGNWAIDSLNRHGQVFDLGAAASVRSSMTPAPS